MIDINLTIINKLGLHARAAAKLAATANQFSCEIKAGRDDKKVNAKSVMSLMLLAASQGTELSFSFDGVDEQDACNAVKNLVFDYFGEQE